MNGRTPVTMRSHLHLQLALIALAVPLAACQRPTQTLPPAPILEVHKPREMPGDDGRATIDDFDAFKSIARIYFSRGRADLTDEARQILDRQAAWLRRHPWVRASLQGHADAFGTREHQVALGEKRAAAMKFHLMARGVAEERLSIASFGKERPAARSLDDGSQTKNRLGETVLITIPGAPRN